MENIEPLVLLQAKSKDLLKIVQKPDIQYVESQFLTSDREYLKKVDLNIDDIYLLDKFFLLTSALPYYKTVGLARKKLQMKIKTTVDDNISLTTSTPTKTKGKCECEFQSEQDVSKKDGMDNNTINFSNGLKCDSRENINRGNDNQDKSIILKCTKSGSGPQRIHSAKPENGFKIDTSNSHYNGNSNFESSRNLTNQLRDTTELNNTNANIPSVNEVSISSSSEKRTNLASNSKVKDISNTHNNIEVKINDNILTKNFKDLNVTDKIRDHSQHISSVPIVSHQTITVKPTPSLNEKEIYDVIFGDKLQSTIHLVLKKSDIATLEAISSQLKQEKMQSWSSESGEKKVVVVNDNYYRGIILPKNNTETKEEFCIKLVDLGWFIPFDTFQQNTVMVLPEKYKSIKPLAFAINIGNEDLIPRNTHAIIQEIGMINEKVKSVRVEKIHPVLSDDIIFNLSTPEPAVAPKPSAVIQNKSLELNSPLRITYIERENNSKENHWVQDAKYSDYYEEWQSLGENYTKYLEKMPLLGDFCLKMTEGDWGRIKVITLEPLTIFHIDFGSTEIVSTFKDLKPMPKEMFSIEPLAYRIKFYTSGDNVDYNFCDVFDIIPIQYSNCVYIVIKNKEELSVIEKTSKKEIPEEVGNQVGLQNEISKAKVESTPTIHTQLADYSYKKAAISQQNVELNKQIKVAFMQYDDTNATHCWVQEDTQVSGDILLKWNEIMTDFKEPFNINTSKPGDFCVKLYEELWCRAKIVSCNPFTVFYVDYGNTEINDDMSQIKPLPEELSHIKPLAMKIEFYLDKSKISMEYGDTFSITPIQIKGNLYVVLKDDEKVEHQNLAEPSAISEHRSLELNKLIRVVFVENDKDDTFKWVQDVHFFDLFENWHDICTAQKAQFVEKPREGEFSIYLCEEIWYRVKIVKLVPLTVSLIDYGSESVVQNVTDLKPLPVELSTVKPLAYKIQFLHKASANKNYEVEEEFGITPIEVRDNVFLVLKDDEVATVQSYIYQYPAPALVLNKSVMVCLLQEDDFDPRYTWVSDLQCAESVEVVALMEESTSKYIHKPLLGELCCKVYDDIWCRTVVAGLDPLTVFYIDYGNVEEVSLDQLKPLPPQAAKYPGFAFRVIFDKKKPDHEFGSTVSLTPISFNDNVYTVTM